MLTSINLSDKSFEQILDEAMNLIPIYTQEWTNYNPSDPGVTILQNLSALNLVQKEYINTVDDRVKLRLLELLGFCAGRIEPASLPLSLTLGEEPVYFPAGTKFVSGDLVFENPQPFLHHTFTLEGLYSRTGEEIRNISYIVGNGLRNSVYAFGEKALPGSSLLALIREAPQPGQALSFYFSLSSWKKERNPLAPGEKLPFARIRWQLYGQEGWVDLAGEDGTMDMICSGSYRFVVPEMKPARLGLEGQEHYCFRALLEEQQYDVLPRLSKCCINVVDVKQQDTKVDCCRFIPPADWDGRIELTSALAINGTVDVYCRESLDETAPFYRQYEEDEGQDSPRVFRKEGAEYGKTMLVFPRRRPVGEILLVSWGEEMATRRFLGTIYGYDNQVIETEIANIIGKEFMVLVGELDDKGELGYLPYQADEPPEKGLCLRLDERTGQITIAATAFEQENPLLLISCRVSQGNQVPVKEGKSFTIAGALGKVLAGQAGLSNPAPSWGGTMVKTISQLKSSLIADLDKPSVAVGCRDYEHIAASTPGLIIHKVRARRQEGSNLVQIAVKPYGDVDHAPLSPLYIRQIRRHLEEHRLVTSRLEIFQPQYVPVDVYGTIYVKQHHENSRDIIRNLLEDLLDYVDTERSFGEAIVYSRIYAAVEQLDCVDVIHQLTLETPFHSSGQNQADIQLEFNQLCYLRHFYVDVEPRININTRLDFDLKRPLI